MDNTCLEKWRKEIKESIRLDFIDGRVDLFCDYKKNMIKIVIKYTEDDRRCQCDEEISIKTLSEGKPDWKAILKSVIKSKGKNRERKTIPNFLFESDGNQGFPNGRKTENETKYITQNDNNGRKVKLVSRADEYKEVVYGKH